MNNTLDNTHLEHRTPRVVLIEETFRYRQTAAAEAPNPQRSLIPPGLPAETLLFLISGYCLHILYRLPPYLIALLPLYLLLRYTHWRQQDSHCYFFPDERQQNTIPSLTILSALTAFLIYLALSALYRAAGGESNHYLFALLLGGLTFIPLHALRRQWRILQKPLLSYQADNQAFVIYQWQDFRHVASKTWPVDNFQGIALRALPINRWQLVLLGKDGQDDILLEEGAEAPLRKRQKILAQSSGMAMLEA